MAHITNVRRILEYQKKIAAARGRLVLIGDHSIRAFFMAALTGPISRRFTAVGTWFCLRVLSPQNTKMLHYQQLVLFTHYTPIATSLTRVCNLRAGR